MLESKYKFIALYQIQSFIIAVEASLPIWNIPQRRVYRWSIKYRAYIAKFISTLVGNKQTRK